MSGACSPGERLIPVTGDERKAKGPGSQSQRLRYKISARAKLLKGLNNRKRPCSLRYKRSGATNRLF